MTERITPADTTLVHKNRQFEFHFVDPNGTERYISSCFNGWGYNESLGELVVAYTPRKVAGPIEIPFSQLSDVIVLDGEQIAEFEAIIPLNGNPRIGESGWKVSQTFEDENGVFVVAKKTVQSVNAERFVVVALGDFLRLNSPTSVNAA